MGSMLCLVGKEAHVFVCLGTVTSTVLCCRLVGGVEVLSAMEAVPTDSKDTPKVGTQTLIMQALVLC